MRAKCKCSRKWHVEDEYGEYGPEAGDAAVSLREDGEPLDAACHLSDEQLACVAHDDQVRVVGDVGARRTCARKSTNKPIIIKQSEIINQSMATPMSSVISYCRERLL